MEGIETGHVENDRPVVHLRRHQDAPAQLRLPLLRAPSLLFLLLNLSLRLLNFYAVELSRGQSRFWAFLSLNYYAFSMSGVHDPFPLQYGDLCAEFLSTPFAAPSCAHMSPRQPRPPWSQILLEHGPYPFAQKGLVFPQSLEFRPNFQQM